MSFPFDPPGRTSRGFTLVEMLVALAVMGILAAVAIPSMSRSTGSHRVVEQARRVHSDLVQVRALAVAEQRRYKVQFYGSNSWRILFEESPANFVPLWEPRTLAEGIDLTIAGVTNETVLYDARGQVLTPRTIVLADDDGHDQRIEVGSSGMIQWFADP